VYMCVRDVAFPSVYIIFQLDFETVPSVWYYLFFTLFVLT